MDKKWRDSVFKVLEEYIISPLGNFSVSHGKLVVAISTICICLFISRPMNNMVILPKAFEDTVGDIPIIEHLDDGKVEIVETPYSNAEYGGWYRGNGGMVSGMAIYTSAWGYQ